MMTHLRKACGYEQGQANLYLELDLFATLRIQPYATNTDPILCIFDIHHLYERKRCEESGIFRKHRLLVLFDSSPSSVRFHSQ
jgi:hypothetical protein